MASTSPRPRRPLIGCTTYRKTAAQTPPIEVFGLMPVYVEALATAGGAPILIPLSAGDEELADIVERVDGLMLPGGGDVEPSVFGASHHASMYDIDSQRDRVEMTVVREAVAQQKPILAICRGIQVFNVALGGTLWLDIASQMPNAIRHDYDGNGDVRSLLPHEVAIREESRLRELIGTPTTPVNSLHHQGIRDLAPQLVVTATAPDGLVEAVELPGHPFALAVQWHPEAILENVPQMHALFEGLVQAAQRNR